MPSKLPPSDGPDTANEALLAALIRRQINLLRLSAYEAQRVVALLNRTEDDLAEKIRSTLASHSQLKTPADRLRYQKLVKILEDIRMTAWTQVDEHLATELTTLVKDEVKFINMTTKTVSPVVLDTIIPAVAALREIAIRQPFHGRILKEWVQDMAGEDIRRIRAQIQAGMVNGSSAQTIARTIVGTGSLKGADGVTELTRRQVESVVLTAISHTTNAARTAYYLDNSDLFSEEQFVATLDSRTTLVCMGNDGKRFPIGTGPQPPLHFRCRSLRVPVLDGDVLSMRPARTFTERQLINEYTEANGLSRVSKRDRLPRGYKTDYDKFKRRRMRELTGRVPGTTTYSEFLKKQSHEFQDEVLGKTKAKLFRDGGLPLDRFTNRAGGELSLAELAKADASAFRAAGLNPDDYL